VRIGVVTPFVDRQHGSERATAELIDRLARRGEEVHLFTQGVSGLDVRNAVSAAGDSPGQIFWHRVPSVGGPHLRRFLHWYRRNGAARRSQQFDVVFSSGVNCPDADVVLVHALFTRLRELAQAPAESGRNGAGLLRSLHRRSYYALVARLESHLYRNPHVTLAAVSSRTARMLGEAYGRSDVTVIPNGVDCAEFCLANRLARRAAARARRGFAESDFVLLLIGNDWWNKGLSTVMEALASVPDVPYRLLIVGEDNPVPFQKMAGRLGIADRCFWERPRPDAIDLYAAADVYVSPSREDSFGLPVLEAMACGLPAITSIEAGVSELIANERDAFVLTNPKDDVALAALLRRLYSDPMSRDAVRHAATLTAAKWTWQRHADSVYTLIQAARAAKTQKPILRS
jgi:glycosyltransferase involved in cell wall biosynthesis